MAELMNQQRGYRPDHHLPPRRVLKAFDINTKKDKLEAAPSDRIRCECKDQGGHKEKAKSLSSLQESLQGLHFTPTSSAMGSSRICSATCRGKSNRRARLEQAT